MLTQIVSRQKKWQQAATLALRHETPVKPDVQHGVKSFALTYFPHRITSTLSHFHADLIQELDTLPRGSKIARIAPRGSAKSTWATLIYVLKRALEGEAYVVIISDIQPNANKFLKDIKEEVEGNEKLRADYPQCRPGAVWREEAIELANGCRIEALGKGGKIRGRRHKQHRPTLVILDDPQSFDDAYSPTQMEKDFQWLMSDVMKVGSPETNFIVLGTALADECIVCKLEKTPGWQFKRYPQLMAEPTNMHLWHEWRELLYRHDDPQRDEKARQWYLTRKDAMDIGSKLLWEDRVPLYEVMKGRYSEGERAFQCEQQGVPMPPGDAEFGMHLFDWDGFWFDEWPTAQLIELYVVDPSMGRTDKAGDYQAIGHIAIDRYRQVFVEAWMEKLNPQQMCEFIVDLHRNKPGEAIVVESNGFQELLKLPFQQVAEKQQIEHLPIYLQPNYGVSKPVRIRRLASPLESRQVRFKRGSRGTSLMVDQIKKFRNPQAKGQHDDGPDMLEAGIRAAWKLLGGKAKAG